MLTLSVCGNSGVNVRTPFYHNCRITYL